MAQGTEKSTLNDSALKTPSKKKSSIGVSQSATQRKILSFFPKSPLESPLASAKVTPKPRKAIDKDNGTPTHVVPCFKTAPKQLDLTKSTIELVNEISHSPISHELQENNDSTLLGNENDSVARASSVEQDLEFQLAAANNFSRKVSILLRPAMTVIEIKQRQKRDLATVKLNLNLKRMPLIHLRNAPGGD